MKKLIVLLVAAIITINVVYAQTPLILTNYTTSNSGLPSNGVLGIAKDKQNNLWILSGTSNLTKYDGTTWTTYTIPNYYNNPGNINGNIAIDTLGNKWIGTTNNGLLKFDGTTWTQYDSTNNILPSNRISTIYVDYNNNIWVGSGYQSIYKLSKFDGTNLTHYNLPYPASNIIMESEGNRFMWITSAPYVMKFNYQNITVYFPDSLLGLANTGCNYIIADFNNKIWLSGDLGAQRYDGSNWFVYQDYNNGCTQPYCGTGKVLLDEFNNKWIPGHTTLYMNDGIICKVKDTTWSYYLVNNTTNWSAILSYSFDYGVIDSIGNKWWGSAQGLWKMDCFIPTTPTNIIGTQYVYKGQNNVTYLVPPIDYAKTYVWTFPNGFTGTSTSNSITVNVDTNAVSGTISVYGHSKCGNGNPVSLNVNITLAGIEEFAESKISIYPNPTKDKLTIETNLNTQQNIEIVNLMGQTIYTSIINKKNTIDVSSFAKGIYTIKIYTDKGTVVKKFVKE